MTEPASRPPASALTDALTAELAKKTGVCWLRYGGTNHPVWHVWLDDAVYVVSGGEEQPLPGIRSVERVEVVMRSKETGQRLVTWVGSVSTVTPDDERWEPVTTALVADRLNLDDLSTAAAKWAESSVVTEIRPTSELVEAPGRLSDDAHLAPPKPTPAITRGILPKVLHRRKKRRPKLS